MPRVAFCSKSKYRVIVNAKRLFASITKQHGHSNAQISTFLGVSRSSAHYLHTQKLSLHKLPDLILRESDHALAMRLTLQDFSLNPINRPAELCKLQHTEVVECLQSKPILRSQSHQPTV